MTELLYFPSTDACYINEFDSEVKKVSGDGVVLEETAFYPRGGGQEPDDGVLKIEGKNYNVIDVIRKGEDVYHILSPSEGFALGNKAHGKIDWDNRYGNMRMHTAQHVISAVVSDVYKAETAGNQVYPDRARIDLSPLYKEKFDKELVEKEFNKQISKGTSINIYFESRSKLLSNPKVRVNLDRLPRHISELRVVDIQGYDVCPCAGTHIRNLNELSPIEITKVKSKGSQKIRIEYRFGK